MSSRIPPDEAKVAERLHSAAIHLLRRLRKTDDASSLSPARLSILSVLVFAGQRTPGELARIEQVKPPTMTGLIRGLEKDGLVVSKVHAHDKRASIVRVTAKGKRKLKLAQELRLRQLRSLLKTLNREEMQVLAEASAVMEKLAASTLSPG